MLIVIPFCNKDATLAIANLEWQEELQGVNPSRHDCLLSYEESTHPSAVAKARDIASRVYRHVETYVYPDAPIPRWPQAPNHAWQNTARYIAHAYKTHWLWLEADAIPLRSGWADTLDEEYVRGRKPLMGAVVEGVVPGSHVNGVAIYPADVSYITTKGLLCEKAAWDVMMAAETRDCRHNASHLIHHLWGIKDGKPNQTAGEPASFKELQQVYDWVNLDCVLCHRVKDDSLIHWLRHMRSSEFNVPKFTRTEIPEVPKPPKAAPVFLRPPVQRTQIFIVTYHKDLPWLDYCLRSVKRFCTGFAGVTLVVPLVEMSIFKRYYELGLENFQIQGFDEPPGKGMLAHMAIECMADQFVPPSTECVLHLDADTVFNGRTDVSQFFHEGKPIYVWRTYESLYDPEKKVNSDCVIWKERTERALGFPTNVYGMCVMPCINSLKLFPEFRAWIKEQHKKPFWDWACSGQNQFPQDWSEYSALGAFAKELMPDLYHWLDCAKEPVPKENSFHFHSHSGLTPKIMEQIEGWLT